MPTAYPLHRRNIHPVHAVLLAGMLPCFLGALLADLAYGSSYEIQWANFASWLIVGGLVFGGFAFLWALIDGLRADVRRDRRGWLYVLILLAAWVTGFLNALIHAKDAWARMPAATVMSVIVFLLTLFALWLGFSTLRTGAVK